VFGAAGLASQLARHARSGAAMAGVGLASEAGAKCSARVLAEVPAKEAATPQSFGIAFSSRLRG
jgi:hypothetical protein